MLGTNQPLSTAATSRARSPTSAHVCWVPHACTPRQDTLPPPSPHHCAQHTLGAAGAPGARTQPAPPPPRPCPGHGAAAGWAAGRLPAPLTSPAPWDRGWAPSTPGAEGAAPGCCTHKRTPGSESCSSPRRAAGVGTRTRSSGGSRIRPGDADNPTPDSRGSSSPGGRGQSRAPGAPEPARRPPLPARGGGTGEPGDGWRLEAAAADRDGRDFPVPAAAPRPGTAQGQGGSGPDPRLFSTGGVQRRPQGSPTPTPSRAVQYLQCLRPAPPGSGGGRDRAGVVPPS